MKTNHNIIIIGAGLTGLTTAYLLSQKGYNIQIIEARDRLGGRIYTIGDEKIGTIEMGATWFGQKHIQFAQLLKELNIEAEEQFMGQKAVYEFGQPHNSTQLIDLKEGSFEPSYRVKGGTSTVIEALATQVGHQRISLGEAVKLVRFKEGLFRVTTTQNEYNADLVISTLPPNLLVNTIEFKPQLPQNLIEVAQNTHTWMSESIKLGFHFKQPFWREKYKVGSIFSQKGPINEMYDHTTENAEYYGLKGFLNGSYAEEKQTQRIEAALKQLQQYFDNDIHNYTKYYDVAWKNEPYTFFPHETPIYPHQNNGNPIFRKDYFEGKLIVAGSETAKSFAGYMNGAVSSALETIEKVLKQKEAATVH